MDFEEFRIKASSLIGINLEGYKEKQLKRRIDHLLNYEGFKGYDDYLVALRNDIIQKQLFIDKLTINVSEFFRNKAIFDTLEKDILPKLLEQNPRLKIWSAACSNGAEPYSVAMILNELTPRSMHTIDATDIDDKILEDAHEGLYKKDLVKNVSPARMSKYFTKEEDLFRLDSEIKKKVRFRKHDLLKDRYQSNYDLIICRNVTIYFTREIQNQLYENFKKSLAPGGILFIGATESVLDHKEFGFNKISPWFYQKNRE